MPNEFLAILFLIVLLNSALLTGNEFAIAALIHPALSRQDHRSNLSAIQIFASLYGSVMPLWMGVTTALQVMISALAWFFFSAIFPWVVASALIWVVVIPYSLIFPVPLNNQVKGWDLNQLPEDWEAIRRKWDLFNWIRVILLISAFVLFSIGMISYSLIIDP